MTLQIKNHKLVGSSQVQWIPTRKLSRGTITPKFIVNHYTAGWSMESAVDALVNSKGKVSCQLAIGRDGEVVQMAGFNRRCWHAGPSRYDGYKDLNSHSVGFEFVNIGFFKPLANGKFIDPYGKIRTKTSLQKRGYNVAEFVYAKQPIIGSEEYAWPTYTQAQLEVGMEIHELLIDKYPIQDVVSHEEIDTRGWKTDPGAAFPMQKFRNLLNHRHLSNEEHESFYIVDVSSLNVRGGAGTQFEKMDWGPIKRGTILRKLDQQGSWYRVQNEQENDGWVHSNYLMAKSL